MNTKKFSGMVSPAANVFEFSSNTYLEACLALLNQIIAGSINILHKCFHSRRFFGVHKIKKISVRATKKTHTYPHSEFTGAKHMVKYWLSQRLFDLKSAKKASMYDLELNSNTFAACETIPEDFLVFTKSKKSVCGQPKNAYVSTRWIYWGKTFV